jgi:hypothetical protein
VKFISESLGGKSKEPADLVSEEIIPMHFLYCPDGLLILSKSNAVF